MSSGSDNINPGAAGIPLLTIVSATYAWFTTPSFTGIQGIFAASAVGMGTTLSTGFGAVVGGVSGLAIGAVAGTFVAEPRACAIALGVLGSLGGGGYGCVKGYGVSKGVLENVTRVNVQPVDQAILNASKPFDPKI